MPKTSHRLDAKSTQVRAFARYAPYLALVIFLGIGGVWYATRPSYAKVDTQAGDAYFLLSERFERSQGAQLSDLPDIEAIARAHPNTIYAYQARLLQARLLSESGDIQGALSALDDALANPVADEGLHAIAILRKVRLLIAQGNYQDALTLAQSPMPAAFASHQDEALGDVYLAQDDLVQAATYYQNAYAKADTPRALLTLKMQATAATPDTGAQPQGDL